MAPGVYVDRLLAAHEQPTSSLAVVKVYTPLVETSPWPELAQKVCGPMSESDVPLPQSKLTVW